MLKIIFLFLRNDKMKQKSLVIGCYATFILIGGIVGFVVAKSLISLIMSGLFACFLCGCCVSIWKGHLAAYHSAMAAIFCLLLFFSYRFLLTYKLAPSGIMAIISGCLFFYLGMARKGIVLSLQNR